ncbi:hypothetical protein HAX54_040617 [Datura stramonium]|uniref:Uncharacterized protein n=1 Tax=Datura stramonium TaxID=4076 RepID=A0ABS8VPV2_DATST|nr:hypothetical protein [Datura stramonium]
MFERVLERVVSTDSGVRELNYDLLTVTQIVESHAISIRHLEERINHLASQIKPRIGMDVTGLLVETVTRKLECIGFCGDNVTSSGKTFHNRVENVDEERM